MSDLRFFRIALDDIRRGMVNPCDWHTIPAAPTLREEEVHLWLMDMDQAAGRTHDDWEILSPDERTRASSFRLDLHRQRFTVRRAMLRRIIGSYVATHPAAIQFLYNPFGKPALGGKLSHSDLQFNLSRSDELAVYAFTRRRSTGIDIEKLKPRGEPTEITNTFFHPHEADYIRQVPPPQRAETFLRFWTLKEAYFKACGTGISKPLDQDDLTGVVRDKSTAYSNAMKASWLCLNLLTTERSIAALVIEA